jgi:hypothetical protein
MRLIDPGGPHRSDRAVGQIVNVVVDRRRLARRLPNLQRCRIRRRGVIYVVVDVARVLEPAQRGRAAADDRHVVQLGRTEVARSVGTRQRASGIARRRLEHAAAVGLDPEHQPDLVPPRGAQRSVAHGAGRRHASERVAVGRHRDRRIVAERGVQLVVAARRVGPDQLAEPAPHRVEHLVRPPSDRPGSPRRRPRVTHVDHERVDRLATVAQFRADEVRIGNVVSRRQRVPVNQPSDDKGRVLVTDSACGS